VVTTEYLAALRQCLGWVVIASLAAVAKAQEGAAPSVRTPPPTIFPPPGTYSNTTSLSLSDPAPEVRIHYTWDGSEPNESSPVFNPHGVLFIAGLYDGNKGLKTGYTLRAVAMSPGPNIKPSEPVTFSYTIERRDRTAYISEEIAPGVRMIRDSDNDKMFLIRGTKRYALIDSGLGRGALRDYIAQFTGGLPLVTIWTHSHFDHIGQADQFIADSIEYVGEGDRQAVADSLKQRGVPPEQIAEHLKSVSDDWKIDLGDRALEIITVPAHTPGSIVIFDPATGNLFTGDSFGNNSNLPPDVLWLQHTPRPLDEYFAVVRTARERLGNRVKLIMTGHNDRPLVGTAYLDNLETALQRAMDEGNDALTPSYRPAGLEQIAVGNRFTDPNWFGVNINPQTFLPAPPDQIASLTLITLTGATLRTRFAAAEHAYQATVKGTGPITISVRPASTRVHSLTIDGKTATAGVPQTISYGSGAKEVPITVTAHDAKTTQTYHVTFSK
jgi:glyoxylase-like metal-dependent hydrolase (beta-lactamase superfamily II)